MSSLDFGRNLVMWAHKFLPLTFHPKWRFNVILLCVYVRVDHMNMTSPKRGQVCIRVGLVTSKWYQSWEKRDEKQTRIWSKEDNGKMLVEFHIRQHSAYIDGIVFADNRMPLIWYLATSTMLSYFLSWKGTGFPWFICHCVS
jgi:hypothetical protein